MHEPDLTPPETSITPVSPAPESFSSPTDPLGLTKQVAPWWHTTIFIVFLVGLSVAGALVTKPKNYAVHHIPSYLFIIFQEWLMLAFVWWGLRMRKIPLSALLGERHRGWRGFGRDVAYAGIFWILSLVVLASVGLLLQRLHIGATSAPVNVINLAPRTLLEFALWACICISAGICEELLFRGYLLRQFSSLGGKVWVGVVVSSLIFGCGHGYEGVANMIKISIFGLLFCALLLKSKSMRPGIIGHAWFDFFTAVQIGLLRHFHKLPQLENLRHLH